FLLAAQNAYAQSSITVEQVPCFRVADNQVIRATANGEAAGGTARLYFRWEERGGYYWVAMEHDGLGRFWGIPPKPEKRNLQVEYYGTLLDSTGREIARSQMRKTEVKGDCHIELNPQQRGVAQNLTVGETSDAQSHGGVMGFLCDGVVTRINPKNIRRADDFCRTCVVAWWQRTDVLAPALAAGGVTTVILDQPEPSPSRP
ncbi:MAG TPA: hypothetical protein VMM92_15840, partial [Thermoanaerobaculia bacterium]|nr:hypothetical protein [Thermoanaerobaculia bacterium]